MSRSRRREPKAAAVRRHRAQQDGGLTFPALLRRWWWLVLLVTAIGGGAAALAGSGWIVALGLVAGLVLGVAAARLAERRDRGGLRGPREIQRLLGLSILGLVPRLEQRRNREPPHRYMIENPASAYARSIKAAWGVLRQDREGRVLLVTSSLPGEGKTTFAVSLAAAAAASGRRVLLVDLDLRRRSVLLELGGLAETGIIRYLTSEVPLAEVVRRENGLDLDALLAEEQTTSPADLIEGERMRALINEARSAYDLVVIDSAPIASVIESRLAAPLADRVVFVVRWGKALRSAAQDSLRELRKVGVEPVGVVLTQIDPRSPLMLISPRRTTHLPKAPTLADAGS